jgi:serine/threonine protein kinase
VPHDDKTEALPRAADGGPATLFQPKQTIAGRYVVERFLARGAMGEVYAVDDPLVGERLALKILRPEVASDARAIGRFRRELQVARRITHPHVCRVHDLAVHDATALVRGLEVRAQSWFLTMELLDGETLAARLERGPAPLDEARAIAGDIAAALTALHALGVVHRDVKPSNVMLTKRGAVVTDFGLARAVEGSRITTGFALLGSPFYMAPEQVTGGPVGTAADLYALGVLLYELVTGRRPFEGSTPVETAGLRLREAPPPPRRHLPSLPASWDAAILRCLERAPEDRFARAEDVIAALQ